MAAWARSSREMHAMLACAQQMLASGSRRTTECARGGRMRKRREGERREGEKREEERRERDWCGERDVGVIYDVKAEDSEELVVWQRRPAHRTCQLFHLRRRRLFDKRLHLHRTPASASASTSAAPRRAAISARALLRLPHCGRTRRRVFALAHPRACCGKPHDTSLPAGKALPPCQPYSPAPTPTPAPAPAPVCPCRTGLTLHL